MRYYSKLLIFLSLCLLTSCHPEPRDRVIEKARSYLNVPYKWAGDNYEGIDCSALIQNSFKEVGIKVPRRALKQAKKGQSIKLSEIRKGDLLFFKEKDEDDISHVGLVIDGAGVNADFIHASGKDKKVLISNFYNSDRKSSFIVARRFFP